MLHARRSGSCGGLLALLHLSGRSGVCCDGSGSLDCFGNLPLMPLDGLVRLRLEVAQNSGRLDARESSIDVFINDLDKGQKFGQRNIDSHK